MISTKDERWNVFSTKEKFWIASGILLVWLCMKSLKWGFAAAIFYFIYTHFTGE